MNLLFVCAGNTCRSPMAQAIAEKLSLENASAGIALRSAGLSAADGLPYSRMAADVLGANGIPGPRGGAESLSLAHIEWADMIFCMDPMQQAKIVGQWPQTGSRCFVLGSWAGTGPEIIDDPAGGSRNDYEACFMQLDGAVRAVFEKILKGV